LKYDVMKFVMMHRCVAIINGQHFNTAFW